MSEATAWNGGGKRKAPAKVTEDRSNDGLAERLRTIVANEIGIDEDGIGPDSNLVSDLGADSLDIHALVLSIEDEFEVSIDEEKDLDSLKTFRDWFSLVEELTKGGGRAGLPGAEISD